MGVAIQKMQINLNSDRSELFIDHKHGREVMQWNTTEESL